MTACPPTIRYLTLFSVKMLNSSSKLEFIAAAVAGMGLDHHLPRCFEDRLRPKTLPVFDVERTVHFGEPPIPLHDERGLWSRRGLVHRTILPLRLPQRPALEYPPPPQYKQHHPLTPR